MNVKAQTLNRIVKLKNGATMPLYKVRCVIMVMTLLRARYPEALEELVKFCRNPEEHQVPADWKQLLLDIRVLKEERTKDGVHFTVHEMTRDVILSMAVGDDENVCFTDPFAV